MTDFTFECDSKYKSYLTRIRRNKKTLLGYLILYFIAGLVGFQIAFSENGFHWSFKNALFFIVFFLFVTLLQIIFILIIERKVIIKLTFKDGMIFIDESRFNLVKSYSGKLSDFVIEKRYGKIGGAGFYYLYIKYLNKKKVIKQRLLYGWTESVVDELINAIKA